MIQRLMLMLLLCSSTYLLSAQCNQPYSGGTSCMDAPLLCGQELNAYCSTLPPNGTPAGPSPLCNGAGVPNNSIWYTFVAGSTDITLQIIPTNCDTIFVTNNPLTGIQAAIFRDCQFSNNAIACQPECQTDSFSLTGTYEIGETYYLLLDGCAGSVCDFSLLLTNGTVLSNVTISGPSSVCTQSDSIVYSVPLSSQGNTYPWVVDAGVTYTDNGASIIVTDWGGLSSVNICMDVSNYCNAGNVVCKNVTVGNVIDITAGPFFYCSEEPGYLFTDGNYYLEGMYTVPLSTGTSCDSVVTFETSAYPSNIFDVERTICKGNTIVFDGVTYSTPFRDSLIVLSNPDFNGCEVKRRLTLNVIAAEAEIVLTGNSDCSEFSNGGVELSNAGMVGGGTLPTYQWATSDGMVCNGVLNDSILLACALGEYCLTVTNQNQTGNIVCTNVDCFTLRAEDLGLDLTLSFTEDTCGLGMGSITATTQSTDTPHTFLWNDANAQTTATAIELLAGTYQVTITSASGCTNVDTLVLPGGEILQLEIDSLVNPTCNGEATGSVFLIAFNGISPYTYQWDMNTGNQTGSQATDLAAGDYSVTASDARGCSKEFVVTISEPAPLVVDIQTSPASSGQSNGAAVATISGGTAPYQILWLLNPNQSDVLEVMDLAPGTYEVQVTDANGCVQTIEFIITTNTGIQALLLAEQFYDIFPNPNTGYFQLHFNDFPIQDLMVEVYDVLGQKVWQGAKWKTGKEADSYVEINLEKAPSGIYFVKITDIKDGQRIGWSPVVVE